MSNERQWCGLDGRERRSCGRNRSRSPGRVTTTGGGESSNRAGSGDATKTLTMEKKERELVSTNAAKSVEQSERRKMHKSVRERRDKNNEKQQRKGVVDVEDNVAKTRLEST